MSRDDEIPSEIARWDNFLTFNSMRSPNSERSPTVAQESYAVAVLKFSYSLDRLTDCSGYFSMAYPIDEANNTEFLEVHYMAYFF